jgi:hypothetical protein
MQSRGKLEMNRNGILATSHCFQNRSRLFQFVEVIFKAYTEVKYDVGEKILLHLSFMEEL